MEARIDKLRMYATKATMMIDKYLYKKAKSRQAILFMVYDDETGLITVNTNLPDNHPVLRDMVNTFEKSFLKDAINGS